MRLRHSRQRLINTAVTKSYALLQLLRLGALTMQEIYEITGWDRRTARCVAYYLRDRGEIFTFRLGWHLHYAANESSPHLRGPVRRAQR